MVPSPNSATTPMKPTASPVSRKLPRCSRTPNKRASSTTQSGTVAMRMPVTEELTHRSPSAIIEKGTTNSTTAKANSAALCRPSGRNAPRFHAIGSRTAVPSATRPQAITSGDSSGTASLTSK